MNLPRYNPTWVDIDEYPDLQTFLEIPGSWRFFSEGKNGVFEMRVMIARRKADTSTEPFNLGFGVWNSDTDDIDDLIEIRNDDMQEILGTVAAIALNFMSQYPGATLYVEGSTNSRTRLYQREIRKIISDLPAELIIKGVKRDRLSPVEFREGINFDGFLLSRR